ncbi:hypothetical protein C8Q72DRAFT_860646 [Fomitopsis betulina]|nr:hypothetical protein C8Q72DRAFT_860646 [Fomitopsis betulina]
MTRLRRDKAGVRGIAPIGTMKCSPVPLLPKRSNVWSTKNRQTTSNIPKLNEVVQHPGIKDALALVDDGPPSWAWWREPVEEWCFEKSAWESEEVDSGENDTVACISFGTKIWSEGPNDPGIIGEPIPRRWPTSIFTAVQRSELGRRVSTKAVSYVLLDKMKPTSAAHHAREGSGCSATTSESSFVEDLFNVWPHVVHEDEDGVKEYLAMVQCLSDYASHDFTVSVRRMRCSWCIDLIGRTPFVVRQDEDWDTLGSEIWGQFLMMNGLRLLLAKPFGKK